MVPIIIAPTRPHSVGDNRAGRGANQPARNRSAGRVASQAADKRAGAATDQCAAQHAIVPRPFAHPASASAIATTTNVLRIRFPFRIGYPRR
jgi:hypothetical protein